MVRMGAVLSEKRRSLAVEEPARPRQLLAHRAGPDDRREGAPKSRLELGSLNRTEPRSDQLGDSGEIRSRRRLPVVERLLPFLEDRSLEPADAHDPSEPHEDLGPPIAAGRVDPRLDAAPLRGGPRLARA